MQTFILQSPMGMLLSSNIKTEVYEAEEKPTTARASLYPRASLQPRSLRGRGGR